MSIKLIADDRHAALKLSAGGHWLDAASAWKALVDSTGGFEALYRLAEAYFNLERHPDAIELARRASEHAPWDLRPVVLMARAQSRIGMVQDAERSWRRAYEAQPQIYEHVVRLAEALVANGDCSGAFVMVARSINIDATSGFAFELLAKILQKTRRADQKVLIAEFCKNLDPNPGAADLRVARQLFSTLSDAISMVDYCLANEKPDCAEAVIRVARAGFDETPALKLREARTCHRLENWPQAANIWLSITQDSTSAFEARFRLAQSLRLMEQPQEAIPHIEAALELNRGHAGALREALLLFTTLNLPTRAEEVFRKARSAHPDDERLADEYLNHLIRVQDFDAARAELAPHVRTAAIDAKNLLFMHLLASARAHDELIRTYEPVLKAAPPDADVQLLSKMRIRLAQALALKRRHVDVLAVADMVLSCDPQSIGAARLRLRALVALDRSEQVKTFSKVIRAGFRDEPLWGDMLAAFADASNLSYAIEILDEATAIFGETPGKWLIVVQKLFDGFLRNDVLERLSRLELNRPSDLERAAKLAIRSGALDLAERLIQSPPDAACEVRWQAIKQEIQVIRNYFRGIAPEDLVFPEAALETLVQRCDGKSLSEWQDGPMILVNSSLAAGGAERQIAITIRGIAEREGRERVVLVCTRLTQEAARRIHHGTVARAGVTTIDLDEEIVSDEIWKTLPEDDRMLIDLLGEDQKKSILKIYECLLRHKPSVVHLWQDTTNIDGALAALLAGVPRIVLSTRSTRPVTRQRLRRYMNRTYRALLKVPHVCMVNNSQAGATDYEDWLELAGGQVHVIHNGFDFEQLAAGVQPTSRSDIRQRYGIPDDAPVLGGVLRLSDVKRPLLWVDVAGIVGREIPEAHFFIAGDGLLHDAVAEYATRVGLAGRFHLPGHVEVPPWYAAMDVALLTSRTEGLPNVLVEAQSLGVPVVSTRVGGVAEALAEGITGFSIPSAEAAELAEPIIMMFRDRAKFGEFREKARGFVHERFGLAAMIEKTMRLYSGELRSAPRQAQVTTPAIVSLAMIGQPPTREPLPQSYAELLALGRRAFDSNNSPEAMRLFNAAMSLAQNPLEPLRWLARAARNIASAAQQARLWRKLLDALPHDLEARLRLADALSELGELTQAVTLTKGAADDHPRDERVTRQLARLLAIQGNHTQSLSLWATLHQKNPANLEAALQAGREAQLLGDSSAQKYLTWAYLTPNSPPAAAIHLARCLMWTGRVSEARAVLRQRQRQFPGQGDLLTARFELLRNRSTPDAMARATRSIERRAEFPIDPFRSVELLVASGQVKTAADRLEAELASGPVDQRQDLLRMLIGRRLGQVDVDGARRAVAMGLDTHQADGFILAEAVQAAIGFRNDLSPGPGSLTQRYYEALARRADHAPRTNYVPSNGLVVHLVNSLAVGGSERQSVAMALADARALGAKNVIVLRTDPAQAGRAVWFLDKLRRAGIRSFSVDDVASDWGDMLCLEGLPPAGLLRNALVPLRALRVAAALMKLRPARVVAWFPQEMVDLALARMLVGIPCAIFRTGSVRPDMRAATQAEALRDERLRLALRAALSLPGTGFWSNSAGNLKDWKAWLAMPNAALNPAVIPNILDDALVAPSSSSRSLHMRKRFNLNGNAKAVGMVARLEPEKGIDLWLDVVEQTRRNHPDVCFLLAGEGRLREQTERAIRKRGLAQHARLTGVLDHELPEFYSMIDVLILTSRFEGTPNVLLEAQLHGVPIVAADVGGVAEILRPSPFHLLISERNPVRFAEAIGSVLSRGCDRAAASADGRAYVSQHFSAAAVGQKVAKFCAEINSPIESRIRSTEAGA